MATAEDPRAHLRADLETLRGINGAKTALVINGVPQQQGTRAERGCGGTVRSPSITAAGTAPTSGYIPAPMSAIELFPEADANHLLSAIGAALREDKPSTWKAVIDGCKLTASPAGFSDKVRALRRFHEASAQYIGPAKRGLLYAALLGTMSKDVLDEGWNAILWDRIVPLEPAEVMLLRRVREEQSSFWLEENSPDQELADRLKKAGLLVLTDTGADLRGVARKILETLGV